MYIMRSIILFVPVIGELEIDANDAMAHQHKVLEMKIIIILLITVMGLWRIYHRLKSSVALSTTNPHDFSLYAMDIGP